MSSSSRSQESDGRRQQQRPPFPASSDPARVARPPEDPRRIQPTMPVQPHSQFGPQVQQTRQLPLSNVQRQSLGFNAGARADLAYQSPRPSDQEKQPATFRVQLGRLNDTALHSNYEPFTGQSNYPAYERSESSASGAGLANMAPTIKEVVHPTTLVAIREVKPGNEQVNGPSSGQASEPQIHKRIMAPEGSRIKSFGKGAGEYRIREKKFFMPGRVFAILWPEPTRFSTENTFEYYPQEPSSHLVAGKYKSMIFQKYRYFIVFKAGQSSCTALAIFTHHRQGFAASNVDVADHGVIYCNDGVIQLSEAEQAKLGGQSFRFTPVFVSPDDKRDKLDPLSRIDYRKNYNIEHNVLVKNVGKVHDPHLTTFLDQTYSVLLEGRPDRSRRVSAGPSRPRAFNNAPANSRSDPMHHIDRSMRAMSLNTAAGPSTSQPPRDYHPDVIKLARKLEVERPEMSWDHICQYAEKALLQKAAKNQ